MELSQIVFVTGFPRSGTTLLENILGNQKDAFFAHQLFPTLFINVKKEFLKRQGIIRDYPFMPNPVEQEPNDFLLFLKSASFTSDQTKKWMLEGIHYPAMGEKQILQDPPEAKGSLIDIISVYLDALAFKNTVFVGFKDVMMDEFIPYFKGVGISTVFIVRDPRAVIHSLTHSNEMGDYRPTLYNLQLWKRGIRNAKESGVFIVKYEDLILDFDSQLTYLGGYLNFNFSSDIFPLKNNKGKVWFGNSSFGKMDDLDMTKLNTFKTGLKQEVISYIESICFNQMRDLGYECGLKEPQKASELKEPIQVNHKAFKNWNHDQELKQELSR